MVDVIPPGPTKPQVFVSYASTDLDRVRGIVAALERTGVVVWFDRDGILGGANYGPEIVGAIRGSRAFVLCCSAAAFGSRNVRQEVALAWKLERPILPLLLEPALVPDDLAYWLEADQWIEIYDREEGDWLPKVLRSLERLGVAASPPHAAKPDGDGQGATRLPSPLTALLGRKAEMHAVVALLGSNRLVTLTGPGGVGKTRLAIEAARAAAAAFADGVTFVDLSPVRDPELVLPTVAQALGIRETGSIPPADALATAIGDRRALLVLDNLEQILDAAPDIAALLSRCPRLAVLATSRAPLAVRGEHGVPVEPLTVPDEATATNLADLVAAPAVALFAERAAEARPGFAVTDQNADVVRAICARLDGLPLALELAASRVKLLPLDRLLRDLDRALPTLTGGARDLPTRQRTLRDAIAWSHDLLAHEERRSSAAWASSPAAGPWRPRRRSATRRDRRGLDGLASLVDKSLVRLGGGDEPRFGMLETVREFAAERLAASDEEDEVRDRHAAWCLAAAEKSRPPMWTPTPPVSLDRLEREIGNLRAALGWFLARRDAASALRLATAPLALWLRRGHVGEGRAWLERALALGGDVPAATRAWALVVAGWCAMDQGDAAVAEAAAAESLTLFRSLGEAFGTSGALMVLGMVATERWEYDLATDLFEEARAVARAGGDPNEGSVFLNNLGVVAALQDDHARAEAPYDESLRIARREGWQSDEALLLDNLSWLAVERGDLRRAAQLSLEAIALGQELRDPGGLGTLSAAFLAGQIGDHESAARLGGAVDALRERTGRALESFNRPDHERNMARARTGLGEDAFAAAWAAGRMLPWDEAVAEAAAVFAAIASGPEPQPEAAPLDPDQDRGG